MGKKPHGREYSFRSARQYHRGMSDTTTMTIHTIVGSTRPHRFSDKPARWIHDQLKAKGGVDAELVDLRDYPLPFFDAATSPARLQGNYPNPVATSWSTKVNEADAYVIVSPEYNHGIFRGAQERSGLGVS